MATQLLLVDTPARNLSTTNLSNWGAAFNPQVFHYQRKDFAIDDVSIYTNVAGNYQAQIIIDAYTFPDGAIDALIGSNIYIKTALYDIVAPVNHASQLGSEAIIIIGLLFPPVADAGGGFLNSDILTVSFKARTTITINGKPYVTRHSGDVTGLIRVDVSAIVKNFIVKKDALDYSVLNTIDANLSIGYALVFGADYYDFDNTAFTIADTAIAGVFYVTAAANQMGNLYGSNVADFVPFLLEPNANKLAKFLTVFKEPVYNSGYPFDIAFIYSDKIQAVDLFVNYTTLDLNKNVIAGLVDVTLLESPTDDMLINATDPFTIDGTAINNSRLLSKGTGVCRLNINDTFSAATAYVQIYLYYIDIHGNQVPVTETKTIKVVRPVICVNKNVYVKWLNLLGGWDYYLFTYDADNGLEIADRSYYDEQVLDYVNADASEEVLFTSARDTVGLSAITLLPDVLRSLNSMNYSPKLYVLKLMNPYKWLTGSVDAKTQQLYNSNDYLGDFTASVKLPSKNLQFN